MDSNWGREIWDLGLWARGCNLFLSVMSVSVECSISCFVLKGLGQSLQWWVEDSSFIAKLRIEGSICRRSKQFQCTVPVLFSVFSPSLFRVREWREGDV